MRCWSGLDPQGESPTWERASCWDGTSLYFWEWLTDGRCREVKGKIRGQVALTHTRLDTVLSLYVKWKSGTGYMT